LGRARLLAFYALLLRKLVQPDQGENLIIDAPLAILEVRYGGGGIPDATLTGPPLGPNHATSGPAIITSPPYVGQVCFGAPSSAANSNSSSLSLARIGLHPAVTRGESMCNPPRYLGDVLQPILDGHLRTDEDIVFDVEITDNPYYGGWLRIDNCDAFRRIMLQYEVPSWPAVLLISPSGDVVTVEGLALIEAELSAYAHATAACCDSLSGTVFAEQMPTHRSHTSPSPTVSAATQTVPVLSARRDSEESTSSNTSCAVRHQLPLAAVEVPEVDLTATGSHQGDDFDNAVPTSPREATDESMTGSRLSIRMNLGRDCSGPIYDALVSTAEPTPVKVQQTPKDLAFASEQSGAVASSCTERPMCGGNERRQSSHHVEMVRRHILSPGSEEESDTAKETVVGVDPTAEGSPSSVAPPITHADSHQSAPAREGCGSREPSIQVPSPILTQVGPPVFHSNFPWNCFTTLSPMLLDHSGPRIAATSSSGEGAESLHGTQVEVDDHTLRLQPSPLPPLAEYPMHHLLAAATPISEVLCGAEGVNNELHPLPLQSLNCSDSSYLLLLFGAGWHPAMSETILSLRRLIERQQSCPPRDVRRAVMYNSTGEEEPGQLSAVPKGFGTHFEGVPEKMSSCFNVQLCSANTLSFSTAEPTRFAEPPLGSRMAWPEPTNPTMENCSISTVAYPTGPGANSDVEVRVLYLSADETVEDLHRVIADMPSTWLCVSELIGGVAHMVLREAAVKAFRVDCFPRLLVVSLPPPPTVASAADMPTGEGLPPSEVIPTCDVPLWHVVEMHAEVKMATDRDGHHFPWGRMSDDGAHGFSTQPPIPLVPSFSPGGPHLDHIPAADPFPPLRSVFKDPNLPHLLRCGGYFVVLCATGSVPSALHDQSVAALDAARLWFYMEVESLKHALWREACGGSTAIGGAVSPNAGISHCHHPKSLNSGGGYSGSLGATPETTGGVLPSLPDASSDLRWCASSLPTVNFYDAVLQHPPATGDSLNHTEELREDHAATQSLLTEFILAPVLEEAEGRLPPREGELYVALVRLPQRTTAVLRRLLADEVAAAAAKTASLSASTAGASAAAAAPLPLPSLGPAAFRGAASVPTPTTTNAAPLKPQVDTHLPTMTAAPSPGVRVPTTTSLSASRPFPTRSGVASAEDSLSDLENGDTVEEEVTPVANVEQLKRFLTEHVLAVTLGASA